ncbi:hypothetical protein D9757_012325 [Collybiopsis confluens]|uniref:Uncharacterized protein n=1 Tax=Collybiopsis confluens TaxID=2823264 RepID=A0A8H5GAI3_9AGAR|nr:hypothetical protein D9757_012325 [Collybiopsis confluens]
MSQRVRTAPRPFSGLKNPRHLFVSLMLIFWWEYSILALMTAPMVLDAGQIVEFDRPSELLKNKDGKLTALVNESADREQLTGMVRSKERSDAWGTVRYCTKTGRRRQD